MITKYTDAYQALFSKATERLAELGVATAATRDLDDSEKVYYGAVIDETSGEKAEVRSLEEYFANLDYLVNGTDENPNSDKDNYIFLRLPLDEPTFKINANERQIYIPDNFKKNGLSVVGDEVAEIVFFEIDRFYDAADLSIMNITIEWERTLNGVTEKRNTPAFIRDIESKASQDKLIFGWPITSAITAAPGSLKFAVRFYQDSGDELQYSWSTLPALITINNTINGDVLSNELKDDASKLIVERIWNSPLGGVGDASIPAFLALNFNDEFVPVIGTNIPSIEAGKTYTLAAIATKGDSGSLAYKWYYRRNAESEAVVLSNPEGDGFITATELGAYIKTSAFIDGIVTYFYKEVKGEEENWIKVYVNTLSEFADLVAMVPNGEVYVRCSAWELNPDNVLAGEYYVDARNIFYNTKAYASEGNNVVLPLWKVQGAIIPVLEKVMAEEARLAPDGSLVLSIKAKADTVDSNTSYTWYRADDEFIELGDDGLYHFIDGVEHEIVSNEANYEPLEQGYYAVNVSNFKNNTTEERLSNSCLVLSDLEAFSNNDINVTTTLSTATLVITRPRDKYEIVTYQWTNAITQEVVGGNENILDLDEYNLEPGMYRCLVTISKGSMKVVDSLSDSEVVTIGSESTD